MDYWDDVEDFHKICVKIANDPCSKCGCKEDKIIYNQHIGNGDYATYDRVCVKCGHVKMSVMD